MHVVKGAVQDGEGRGRTLGFGNEWSLAGAGQPGAPLEVGA